MPPPSSPSPIRPAATDAWRTCRTGAENFTTIELKSNFLGTLREGTIMCVATPAHLGRTTQGLGRGGDRQGERTQAGAVSLYADGPLAPQGLDTARAPDGSRHRCALLLHTTQNRPRLTLVRLTVCSVSINL